MTLDNLQLKGMKEFDKPNQRYHLFNKKKSEQVRERKREKERERERERKRERERD